MKAYIEKISELIIKGRIRLCQLSGTDPAEIGVPLTNAEMMSLWMINGDWQRACSNYLGEINNKYLKSKCIQNVKWIKWTLPFIVKRIPIPEVLTFYTDANKMEMAGYKSDKISMMIKNPYISFQTSEFYSIIRLFWIS